MVENRGKIEETRSLKVNWGQNKKFQNQGSSWKRHIKRLKSIEIRGKIENFENMKDNWGWNWDIQDQWPNWKKDARLIGSF